MRNRLFPENQAKDCQEIEELRRICCEETDRARQARIDEFLDCQVSILEMKMPNSLNCCSESGFGLLEQVVVQKTFPEVPTIFRESCGNPESRQCIGPGLGIVEG